LVTVTQLNVTADNTVSTSIDDYNISYIDVEPENVSGRMFVPLRLITENMYKSYNYSYEPKKNLEINRDNNQKSVSIYTPEFLTKEAKLTSTAPIDYFTRIYENIKFVNSEMYSIIEESYENIDFKSQFNKGNIRDYDIYKENYRKLLNCESTFYDKRTQQDYYINQFNEMNYADTSLIYGNKYADIYDPNNYIYYFFDMDDDGSPELCITNEIRFVYIIKYDVEHDRFVLWYEIPGTWERLFGSKKLWVYGGGMPVQYAYYELSEDGEIESTLQFYLEGYYDNDIKDYNTMYMVAFPIYTDKNKQINLTDEMIEHSVYDKYNYYFRVTEDQWKKLTNPFFESRELSKEKIKDVTFTYQELFEN
jgi:hypothetical protein